jgi:phenylalanyl-tRNA synthetase beta subunit
MGRNVVGAFGVIHPVLREACDLREPAFYAELDLRLAIKFMGRPEQVVLSEFPAISRDMTVAVELKKQAGRVLRLINEARPESLTDVVIVDDFAKPGEGFRRVTYRLEFQRADRTLKHDEVDGAIGALLQNLKEKHGIQLAL